MFALNRLGAGAELGAGHPRSKVVPSLVKGFKRRTLDLFLAHHERIEAWILEQAGVKFAVQAAPGKLMRASQSCKAMIYEI